MLPVLAAGILIVWTTTGCRQVEPQRAPSTGPVPGKAVATQVKGTAEWTAPKPESKSGTAPKQEWQALFDGKSLAGWKVSEFGGSGDVEVQDGKIMLHMGVILTGVTWTNESMLPKTNYELSLEAMKVDGSDFFCGLTFPVADSHCSFIVGGWGGGVVGISSVDGMDASENETTRYMQFDKGRWYSIRVRVTPDKLSAWIDGEEFVDQTLENRRIEMRLGEIELSRPLGIAAYQTTAALRNIRLRRLE